MNANEDLRREMEAHLNNQQATNVGDATEAQVVPADEDAGGAEVDPVAAILTRAVQQPEGWQTIDGGGPEEAPTHATTGTPPSSTPPTGNSLNAGVDGDEQLTAWLNNRLNS